MRLQKKLERWQCLPASFAMALDIPLASVFKTVGHDGSQIIVPTLPEPLCRRGFHPQELVDVCLGYGYAATYIELAPCMVSVYDSPLRYVLSDDMAWLRFISTIQISRGVIEGVIEGMGVEHGHAVAYDHGHIFDPDGWEYVYSRGACERQNFFTRSLWRIDRIGGETCLPM